MERMQETRIKQGFSLEQLEDFANFRSQFRYRVKHVKESDAPSAVQPPSSSFLEALSKKQKRNEQAKKALGMIPTKLETKTYDTSDSENWRNVISGIRQVNDWALKEKFLSDVTFKVGPNCEVFHAHKLILCIEYPVFEAMFYGGLPEKEEVIVPDLQPEGFSGLLKYVYTEKTDLKNFNDAYSIYLAADKYGILNLKEVCEKYISSCHLSPENIWEMLHNALFMNMEGIKKKCLGYLKRNTQLAVNISNFLEAGVEAVEQLLLLDTVDVNELFLLRSITWWADAKVNADPDKTVEEVLRPLLPHIRFGNLSPKQFCVFIEERNDVLEDSDALVILKHLVNPLSCSLPEWCCPKSWRMVTRPSNDILHSTSRFHEFKTFPNALMRDRSRSASRRRGERSTSRESQRDENVARRERARQRSRNECNLPVSFPAMLNEENDEFARVTSFVLRPSTFGGNPKRNVIELSSSTSSPSSFSDSDISDV